MTGRHILVVIGAGPVGLAMAKALLQHGIPYEQLEADDDLGGNWYHGVYETAHIISSRKTTEFADFPMPDNYPDFPSAQQLRDYLASYAEAFKLRAHIQLRTKVTMCLPLADGRWQVELAGGEKRIYKGVIVCNRCRCCVEKNGSFANDSGRPPLRSCLITFRQRDPTLK